MSKEREILQMFKTGISQRNIALGLHVSRNTVSKVVTAYKSADIPSETRQYARCPSVISIINDHFGIKSKCLSL